MIYLTDEKIREIADELDMGMKCGIHLRTGELVTFPDPLKNPYFEEEDWQEPMRKVEEHPEDYLVIEGMGSREAFGVMEDFAGQVDSSRLRERLYRALSQRKPFAHFKSEIDRAGDYRQAWFDFKRSRLVAWVTNEISFFNNQSAAGE